MIGDFSLSQKGGQVAIIGTQSGELEFIGFTPIIGRYFTCPLGFFQTKSNRQYRDNRTAVSIYDSNMGSPLDIAAIARIRNVITGDIFNETALMKSDLYKIEEQILATVKDDPTVKQFAEEQAEEAKGQAYVKRKEFIKQDLVSRVMRDLLTNDVVAFLDEFKEGDRAAMRHAMNKATRGEKPPKMSGAIFMLPSIFGPNVGIVFSAKRQCKIVWLSVEKNGNEAIGSCRYGEWDLSDVSLRYSHRGKAVHILYVETSLEEAEARYKKQLREEGRDGRKLPMRKKSPFPAGRSKGLPKPVSISASKFMSDFSPFRPAVINERVYHAKYQRNTHDQATKPLQKKQRNIMMIAGTVLIVLLIWQMVGRDELSNLLGELDRQAATSPQSESLNPNPAATPPAQSETLNPTPNLIAVIAR